MLLKDETPAEGAGEGRSPRRVFLLIFLLALACRAWFLWRGRSSPFAEVPIVDAREYHVWAQSIASGRGLIAVWAHHSPLYPLILAAFYKVFGVSPWPVYAFQALLGALTAVLCAAAAWRSLACVCAAGAAGMAAALAWPFLYPTGHLLPQTLEMFLAASALWLLSGSGPPSSARALLAGCACGAVASMRPQAAPGVLAAAAVFGAAWPKRAWRTSALFLAPALAAALGWSACLSLRGIPSFLQTRSGMNLFIGSHAGATGLAADYPGLETLVLKQRAAVAGAVGPAEDAYFRGQSLDWLKSDSAGFARLWVKRLALSLAGCEIPAGEAHPWPVEGTHPLLRVFGFAALLGIGLPGLAYAALKTHGIARPAAALFAAGVAGLSLAGAAARYRAPLLPVLALGAGCSAFFLRKAVAEKCRRSGFPLVLGSVVVGLLSTWAASLAHLSPGRELAIALSLEARGGGTQGDRALGMLEAWTAGHPRDWDALWHVGLMRIRMRDWPRAGESFDRLAEGRGQDLPQLHSIAAWLSLLNGERSGAGRAAEASFREDPGSLEACFRAALYARLADPKVDVAGRLELCPLDPGPRRPAHPAAEELAMVLSAATGGNLRKGTRIDFQTALAGVEEAYWNGWQMDYPVEPLRRAIFSQRWHFVDIGLGGAYPARGGSPISSGKPQGPRAKH